ncbi:MAG: cell division protein ZapA [Chitinophagaceae bacterium]|nr:cell division protein ZapA [Chitinophagaceae bacterium]
MSEIISINVTIGDRMYPLKVRGEDEPVVRQAEQLLNHKYSEFQLRFSGQEKLDYLAMSSLMNMVEVMKQQEDIASLRDELAHRLTNASQLVMDGLKRS